MSSRAIRWTVLIPASLVVIAFQIHSWTTALAIYFIIACLDADAEERSS